MIATLYAYLFGADDSLINPTAAGWTGTISFGSLLTWLLVYHIPNLNRENASREAKKEETIQNLLEQLQADRNKQDTRVDFLIEAHRKNLDQLTAVHTSGIQAVVKHCEEEMKEVTGKYREDTKALVDAIDRLARANDELHQKARSQISDIIHAANLKAEVERQKQKQQAANKGAES